MALRNIQVIKTQYPDLELDAGTADFGEMHRIQMKDASLRKAQCNNIVRSACALLNSGGGIICVKVRNEGYNQTTDGIGLDIEQAISSLVKGSSNPSFSEFRQQGSTMRIFVQSWTNKNDEGMRLPRLCSITSNVYKRSYSQCDLLIPTAVEDLFRSRSIPSLSSNNNKKDSDSCNGPPRKIFCPIPKIENTELALAMLDQKQFQYGEILNFTESDHIEFKDFSGAKYSTRIKEALPKLISAFSNTEGGFIFIGVSDKLRKVVGCTLDEDPRSFVSNIIETKLKNVHNCSVSNTIEYTLNVASVMEGSERCGSLLILHIKQSHGVVFADDPDCWKVEDDHVKRIEAGEWTRILLAKDPEIEELCLNFKNELSVTASPPRCKPVFSLRDHLSLDNMIEAEFKSSCGIKTFPETICEELFKDHPGLENLLPEMKPEGRQGILIFSRSWAVDIDLPRNQGVICDALLLAAGEFPLFYTIAREGEAVTEYSRNTAMSIKQKMVNLGGYAGKLCIIPKILYYMDADSNKDSQWQTVTELQVLYPPSYKHLTEDNITEMQKAVIILLLHFKSFLSDQIGSEFLNLQTLEQFQILHLKHNIEKCKKLFIHGLPGTGKTVMAGQLIRRIINTFHCGKDEVLYISETTPLQQFMSQRFECTCVTRKTFMTNLFPNVKHIIVDEAQNFRREDGKWYEKAEDLRTKKETHPDGPGVFWIFMDYFQTSHPFPNGLPKIHWQDPREELTLVVRNAKKIHDVVHKHLNNIVRSQSEGKTQKFLKELSERAICSHSFEGEVNKKHEMTRKEIVRYIASHIESYFKEGYSPKDIAILCRTEGECESYSVLLQPELTACVVKAEEILEDCIVLDSLRRFSGLERTIVFAINPVPHPDQGEIAHNVVVCVASRARTKLHILYED
ncbi:schlafen family member 13-like [Pristis pectinata]|uniref:schlafen family member 13-like n=1 Tax=Pristis pectinata TaxID=685728 RepID=UPI00223DD4C6|nr:schlafen family member 13-like [Pristis pectinata]XP_051891113.1 schlafen family member 13-like [Pristis pectinata]